MFLSEKEKKGGGKGKNHSYSLQFHTSIGQNSSEKYLICEKSHTKGEYVDKNWYLLQRMCGPCSYLRPRVHIPRASGKMKYQNFCHLLSWGIQHECVAFIIIAL